MSAISPLKLYFHGPSPNPWKVAVILEELHVPYELVNVENVKSPEFLAISPNGRVPALEDPNTGITTWESGSNIEYLIDEYGVGSSLNATTKPEKYWQNNWKHFQMSGQGPYFGQKAWFAMYHPEKVPSAVDRYDKEIRRIIGVIDLHLGRSNKPYLVGDNVSYADLMFVPWNSMIPMLMGADFAEEWKETYPHAYAWNEKLMARESVKKTFTVRKEKTGH